LTEEEEAKVNTLMEISGKTKEECTIALRIARGDSDIAYEFLANGVPEELL
jgi:hypothetical protein